MTARIALVEDNPDNRLLLCALLEDEYELGEYETGAEALAHISASNTDLVILDISLPGMDGEEVLAALRAAEATAKLPVIALTAHAMAGDRERLMALGFDAYFTKPITDEAPLLETVARLVTAGPRPSE